MYIYMDNQTPLGGSKTLGRSGNVKRLNRALALKHEGMYVACLKPRRK